MIITQKNIEDMPPMKTWSQIKLELLWKAIDKYPSNVVHQTIKREYELLMEDYESSRNTTTMPF